jgi:hypothetical protein
VIFFWFSREEDTLSVFGLGGLERSEIALAE